MRSQIHHDYQAFYINEKDHKYHVSVYVSTMIKKHKTCLRLAIYMFGREVEYIDLSSHRGAFQLLT
jgi:hypothetical protein